MSQTMTSLPSDAIFYPESDGEPMGETDFHRREMLALIEILEWHFREQPDVYVAGNNFLYYEEGNPRAQVSPDVYVVRGVSNEPRRIFQLWKEGGRTPCFVMEVSSRSTWLTDHGNKKALYATLGVQDYFLFDPEADYLDPPLQGYRLHGREYRRLDPDSDGSLAVETLGLSLAIEARKGDIRLIVRDATTGQVIPRPARIRAQAEELAKDNQALADKNDALTRERDALAARIAELEAKRD